MCFIFAVFVIIWLAVIKYDFMDINCIFSTIKMAYNGRFFSYYLFDYTGLNSRHVSCFVSLSNIFSLVCNLTMNRLTNEQRLQIIEFYYEKACSVKKVNRALLPFYGQFNWPTEAAIRAIVTKFRTKFTLLDIKPYQHAYGVHGVWHT